MLYGRSSSHKWPSQTFPNWRNFFFLQIVQENAKACVEPREMKNIPHYKQQNYERFSTYKQTENIKSFQMKGRTVLILYKMQFLTIIGK